MTARGPDRSPAIDAQVVRWTAKRLPWQPEALDIRPARPTDAQALAALSSQLGYPVAVGSLTDRLDRLLGRADQVVMVACAGSDGVVGWIHGADEELLEAERRCEILGLVVSHT